MTLCQKRIEVITAELSTFAEELGFVPLIVVEFVSFVPWRIARRRVASLPKTF